MHKKKEKEIAIVYRKDKRRWYLYMYDLLYALSIRQRDQWLNPEWCHRLDDAVALSPIQENQTGRESDTNQRTTNSNQPMIFSNFFQRILGDCLFENREREPFIHSI